MKDLLVRARVVVRTSNMKISRLCLAETTSKKKKKKSTTGRTARAFLPHSINHIVDL